MGRTVSLLPGDVLKVERRFLVDGVVTTETREGRFAGVESVGSAEHLVLEDAQDEVRLVPLHAIHEIILVRAVARAPPHQVALPWDPSVA